MNLPRDPHHPLYSFLSGLTLALVLFLFLRFGYENGFSPEKDGPTLIGLLATYYGLSTAKTMIANRKRPPKLRKK